jgi:hypothetical protein
MVPPSRPASSTAPVNLASARSLMTGPIQVCRLVGSPTLTALARSASFSTKGWATERST